MTAFVEENLTFTMTATAGPVAGLDAMQYLDGGPCEQTLRAGDVTTWQAGDSADEDQWQLLRAPPLGPASSAPFATCEAPRRGERRRQPVRLQ